jgi:hypothetical protein
MDNTELEKDFNERLKQIKNLYELRLEGLQETLKLIFKEVQNDELIDTMSKDQASSEFVQQRIQEIT